MLKLSLDEIVKATKGKLLLNNNKEVEYIPKINEKKFIAKESNSFLNKFFNGNTEKLLLNFVENKKVTKNELQKLIDILEQDEE